MPKSNSHNTAVIKKLQEEVKEVYKTVYQGNGKPAIVTQLSDLQGRIKSHHEQIDTKVSHVYEKIESLETEIELKFKNITDIVTERFNNISTQIASEFGRKHAERISMWNFKTAVTTAALASFTSVFVLLLSEFIKRISG